MNAVEVRERLAGMTPAELAELDALLTPTNRDRPYRDYVSAVNPLFQWHKHHEVIADALEAVCRDELFRLAIFAPPRHGKSEMVSRILPGKYLERHPDRWVGLATYGHELSYALSRDARRYYMEAGNPVSSKAAAVGHWETGLGGGMWATGTGGAATGKGMHLGIIDDPVKDAKEAQSETDQRSKRDWYNSVFRTRRQLASGRVALVAMMTRWNDMDIAAEILDQERRVGEGWYVIDLPALAEAPEPEDYPESVALFTDWREPGEALCPAWLTKDQLQAERERIGTYWFSALYQQRPRPREGGMFKRHWFDVVDEPHPLGRDVRWWDRAATDGDGDYTAGIKVRRAKDGTYYVLDVKRGQWASGERDRLTRKTAREDGPHVAQWTEQEPGASGKDAALAFVRLLEGYGAHFQPASGTKELRADPLASAAQAGMVKLVKAPWNKALLDELTAFPTGTHDDQVDALASAFNVLAKRPHISVDPDSMSVHQTSRWAVA